MWQDGCISIGPLRKEQETVRAPDCWLDVQSLGCTRSATCGMGWTEQLEEIRRGWGETNRKNHWRTFIHGGSSIHRFGLTKLLWFCCCLLTGPGGSSLLYMYVSSPCFALTTQQKSWLITENTWFSQSRALKLHWIQSGTLWVGRDRSSDKGGTLKGICFWIVDQWRSLLSLTSLGPLRDLRPHRGHLQDSIPSGETYTVSSSR